MVDQSCDHFLLIIGFVEVSYLDGSGIWASSILIPTVQLFQLQPYLKLTYLFFFIWVALGGLYYVIYITI